MQLILASVMAHIALAGSRVTTSLYALSLHTPESTIGILIALFSLFPMLFAVRLGRLIDRIGVVKPMGIGALSLGIGCALPVMIHGLTMLYLAGVLIGTGFMAIHIGSQHAVGAMHNGQTRSRNFSWLSLGYSVSSFCGPVIAGFIIDHASHRIAYALFSGFALTAATLAAYGTLNKIGGPPPDQPKTTGSTLDLLRNREMQHIYLIGTLLSAAWDLFTFALPIHGTHLGFSASLIGLILGCFSVATFTVRLMLPWISRRYSEWQILAAALAMAVLCYLLLPFMQQPVYLMFVAALLGAAVGSSQPNMLALLHQTAPADRTAEAVGIRVTIGNASQVVLPLAFGIVGTTLGLWTVFWGVGAMIGMGVPFAWRKAWIK